MLFLLFRKERVEEANSLILSLTTSSSNEWANVRLLLSINFVEVDVGAKARIIHWLLTVGVLNKFIIEAREEYMN